MRGRYNWLSAAAFIKRSSDRHLPLNLDYVTPPPALPRLPVSAIILSALAIPFLLLLGGMSLFGALGSILWSREPWSMNEGFTLIFGLLLAVIFILGGVALADSLFRNLRGAPPRELPWWLDLPPHPVLLMLAGLIRLALAAWGVTLAYLMIGSFNLGLLTWYTELIGPPPIITKVLSAVMGGFFLIAGLYMIAVELRALLFRRRVPDA